MTPHETNRQVIEALSLPPQASLRDVIAVIDRGAAQMALVMEAGRLVGIVTDGDVRRGLLRGESLDTPVRAIMRQEFRSLPASGTAAQALAVMQRETLQQIPVIDESGKVLHLFLLQDLVKLRKRPNSVVGARASACDRSPKPVQSLCCRWPESHC